MLLRVGVHVTLNRRVLRGGIGVEAPITVACGGAAAMQSAAWPR